MSETQTKNAIAGITVRPATAADLPHLLRIEQTCYPPDAWPEDEFTDRLACPESTILVVEQAGEIVASIIYTREYHRVHLENVAVLPSARRQGIARLLVQRVIEDLPRLRRKHLLLEVRKSNQAAQSCYRQLGFRDKRVKPGYYEDGEDALDMEYITN